MIDQPLAQFMQTRSADAFRALVDRHGKAVYAQCVRELRDPHLAEDVTQAVFIVLARKAAALPPDVVLPAWLFKVTHFACANARRGERRRRHYEQEAAMTRQLQALQEQSSGRSSDLELAVDGALSRLGRVDREAIVLRFYNDMNAGEVATALGMSAEATRRRISRALEKLRKMLAAANVNVAPALMIPAMTDLARSGIAPPIDLLERVTINALHPGTAIAWPTTVARKTIQMMRWTQIKVGLAAAVAVVVIGAAGTAMKGVVLAQLAPAAPAPAQVAAIPPSAPAAGAPEAAVDQEMIRITVTRFVQAIRNDDVKAIDQLMVVSNDPEGELVKAMIMENVAYRHVQTAWASKFTGPVQTGGYGFAWVPTPFDGGAEVVLELALTNLKDSDIQFNGNTARLPLRLAPAGKKPSPALDFWRGWWLSLVNDGASWKIDGSKTLRVNVSLTFVRGKQPGSSEDEMKIALEQKRQVATILEDIALAIERGQLASPDAANQRIGQDISTMQRRLGLAGVSYGLAPARPASTEVAN
jgi:RNA polymerase sigma factor (sigma-70 family)